MDLTPVQATAVLNAAMQHNMKDSIPESDKDKVSQANEIIELSLQGLAAIRHLGQSQVPMTPAIKAVLSQVGLWDLDDPPAATPEPAPVAPGQTGAAGQGTAGFTPPPVTPAPQPAPAPVAPPAPVPQTQPELSPAEPYTAQTVKPNEIWADVHDGQWEIINPDGPQIEARRPGTTEPTLLPADFLIRRVTEAPAILAQTQPAPTPPPIQEPSPTPLAAPPVTPAPPSPQLPQNAVTLGEHRLHPIDRAEWVLQQADIGTVFVTDVNGGQGHNQNRADYVLWPVVEGVFGLSGTNPPPGSVSSSPAEAAQRLMDTIDAHAQPGPQPGMTDEALNDVAQEQALAEQPVPADENVSATHTELGQPETTVEPDPAPVVDNPIASPMDNDEGDDDYANVLAKVSENYEPVGMPTPMELSREPAPMPDDLTATDDLNARALHSQFNALAARARYLHGLEAAKGRACERLYKYHLKFAMREARREHGAALSVTEIQQYAEENEAVANWARRRDLHKDRADAYATFLANYNENVTVLSRDWTMRAREEQGS